jgi:phenylacetic acid degradation operon negative regulatory protein
MDAPREPRLSRRHTAGTDSARGLVFTVLGEFVLPAGGSAWTAAFIDGLARLDIEEKAARQALTRTAADGWLTSERVGRRTRWSLTDRGRHLLIEGTERIYGFTGSPAEWDGQWVVVLARAPETDRAARHVLRTRLGWAGFGPVAPGVWVSPHAERVEDARRALAAAGPSVDGHVFCAGYAAGDQDALVRQAWELDDIARAYERFRTEFTRTRTADPLGQVIALVHAWRRFPWLDPALPVVLLPRRWSGHRAAALFAQRHAAWSPAARREWARLDSD